VAFPKKKLILAYPPYSMPTSPPLGVCSLKGFVEKSLSDWSASVIDLNLLTCEQLFAALSRGAHLDRNTFPEGVLAEIALAQAEQVFRGADNNQFFHRPDRYTTYADVFLRLLENQMRTFPSLEAAYHSGALPPFIEQQADLVLRGNPDAVGISVCYSQQIWAGLCLGKAIKQRSTVPVIFGGTYFCEDGTRVISEYPDAVDYIVIGEGEHALAQLLENLDSPQQIPGVMLRAGDQCYTTPPEYENNLDALGCPDFSDLPLPRYYSPAPVIPILSSRGCYWRRCAFCVHYKSAGLTYRQHSINQVIKMLAAHAANGVTHFALIDEMISPGRFHKLAQAINEAGLNINYYALAKPVKEFTHEVLLSMCKSGCKYILWGVESASQRVLDLMDKGTSAVDMARVLEDSHAVGLRNHVYIIAGFPTETREEFLDTLSFLEQHKTAIDSIHRGMFRLEKGSPVFDDPVRFSISDICQTHNSIVQDKYEYHCVQGMSREEINQVFQEALPFLRSFGHYSRFLANFRDHALLVYARP
jgi:anaerobic magnesium-protoporphyrin IX monomethyl ester cyclase